MKERSERYSPHGNGYVKMYRKLLTSAVFQNEKLLKVWVWCLIRANWTEPSVFFDGKQIKLRVGQFITGRFTGAEQCNMKPKTFYNQLLKLSGMGNLILDSDNRRTLITVVNYTTYQGDVVGEWTTDGQLMDNQRTTDGQLVDTDKEVKHIRSKEVKKTADRPESLDAVRNLFVEREYVNPQGEAEKFYDHYQSNGWVIGKGRAPCRDWTAAAANWNRNAKEWDGNGTYRRSNREARPEVNANDLKRASEEIKRRHGR